MNTLTMLANLRERVDALALRERVLVLTALAALVFTAWQTLFMDPLDARHRAAEGRIEALRNESTSGVQDGAAGAMTTALERERALRDRLAHLNAEINVASGAVVTPAQMATVLQEVLVRKGGLRLVSIDKLPPAPVTAPEPDAPAHGPYVHPLELVVEGEFSAVTGYLRELERLPWSFYWRGLEVDATSWPSNRVRIELGTLSTSIDWMGAR
jgi:MSHA biogenesis protein MshJ